MRGNSRAGADHFLAVFLGELVANVGVQRVVERPHLIPQAIHLRRERVGRHVVFRPPHRAGILEAEVARADVGQIHHLRVALAHRRRNGMPAFPRRENLVWITAARHGPFEIVQRQAFSAGRVSVGSGGTILAFAVIAIESHGNLGEPGLRRGILRRGQRQRQFQQKKLARVDGRKLESIEARGFQRQIGGRGKHFLLRVGGNALGVVGDEVFLDPARALRFVAELEELLFGLDDELVRLGHGGRLRHQRHGHGQHTQQEQTISHGPIVAASRDWTLPQPALPRPAILSHKIDGTFPSLDRHREGEHRLMAKSTEPSLLQGTLDLLILHALQRGELHGFAIAQTIHLLSDQVLTVEEGSLYPALYRLELDGAISAKWGASENNRKAKFYEITKHGKKLLANQQKTWTRLSSAVQTVLAR